MINNKSTFNPHGITIPTPDGGFSLVAGQNITIRPTTNSAVIAAIIPANIVINDSTPYIPVSLLDSSAPNGCLYFSLTSNKLSFKDFSSVVHALY